MEMTNSLKSLEIVLSAVKPHPEPRGRRLWLLNPVKSERAPGKTSAPAGENEPAQVPSLLLHL